MSRTIRVLHVDDDPAFRDLAAELIERADDSLTVASEADPTAVPARLETEPFDCVVSDLEMPQLDGLELCRRLRSDYPEFPFVLFTNRSGEAVVDRALAAGATDCVHKQTGTHQYRLLANRIALAVGRYRALCRLGEVSEPPGDIAAAPADDGRPTANAEGGDRED